MEAYQNRTFSVWNVLDVGENVLRTAASRGVVFSEGRKHANRIAASETGQKIVSGIKAFAADNRGCVDLEALGLVKSKGDFGKQIISNKFPNDNQAGRIFNYTIEGGKINIENGIQNVDFVIDMNGNLHIGRGHSYLAGGQSVQAAGTMKVNSQGYIRNITNKSGHFQPTVSETMNYPQIFRNSGLNVDNAWIRISEFDTSMSNYVIDERIFYQGPIQYIPH